MDRNLFLALTLSATFQCLAQTPEPMEVRRAEAVFEELPELKASEILKPELLQGPHFVVRDPVPTGSGMNQFTIDSDFGVFEADGNEMLLQRLKEIDAIARLQEVSRTDEFKKSLVAAAKSPLNSARNIARDPAQAISNVPKGVMKFLFRFGSRRIVRGNFRINLQRRANAVPIFRTACGLRRSPLPQSGHLRSPPVSSPA